MVDCSDKPTSSEPAMGSDEYYEMLLRKAQEAKIWEEYIVCAGRAFKTTKNPMFAWQTWLICRAVGLETPAWVLRYLDRTSINLLKELKEPKPGVARKISGALGFGRGKAGSAFFSEFCSMNGLVDQYQRARRKGFREYPAYDEAAAALEVDSRTVRDRIKDLCNALGTDVRGLEGHWNLPG